jgi:hypothetical protein
MPIAIAGCDPADSTCQYCQPTSAGCAAGDGSPANPYRNCKLLQTSSANNGNGNGNDQGNYQDSGWTTFGTPSANAPSIKALVGNNSTCGNIPPINIGSGCIYLNNGQITPVLSEFDNVYSQNPTAYAGLWDPLDTANPNNHPIPPEDWGIIPVVRKDIGNFNGCEPVKSFAKFGIRGVITNGNDKWLVGDLICQRKLSELGGTACYTTQLVRDTKSGM